MNWNKTITKPNGEKSVGQRSSDNKITRGLLKISALMLVSLLSWLGAQVWAGLAKHDAEINEIKQQFSGFEQKVEGIDEKVDRNGGYLKTLIEFQMKKPSQ